MTVNPTAVKAVIAALGRGDIEAAEEAFAVEARRTSMGEVARAVCFAAPPPANTIILGPAMYVWANPFREDHGWRCGNCRCTAGLYKTPGGAQVSAYKHADEHPGITVRTIHRPEGT